MWSCLSPISPRVHFMLLFSTNTCFLSLFTYLVVAFFIMLYCFLSTIQQNVKLHEIYWINSLLITLLITFSIVPIICRMQLQMMFQMSLRSKVILPSSFHQPATSSSSTMAIEQQKTWSISYRKTGWPTKIRMLQSTQLNQLNQLNLTPLRMNCNKGTFLIYLAFYLHS